MKLAASLARNTTALASSVGVPYRRSGTSMARRSTAWSPVSPSRAQMVAARLRIRSVRMCSVAMLLTRTSGAASRASVLAMPTSAGRSELESISPSMGCLAVSEARLTMAPPPSIRSAGSAPRDSRTALIKMVSKAWRHISSSRLSSVPGGGATVLLMSTSRPPRLWRVQSRSSAHSSASPMSAAIAITSPRSSKSRAVCRIRSSLLEEIATLAPSARKASATARPNPLLAAVTRTRFPLSPVSIDVILGRRAAEFRAAWNRSIDLGMSAVKSLICRECQSEFEMQATHVCDLCFGPLEVRYDHAELERKVSRESITAGPNSLWRYRDLLPLNDGAEPVTLGEGMTPLVRAERLGARLGPSNLYLKNQTVNPPT